MRAENFITLPVGTPSGSRFSRLVRESGHLELTRSVITTLQVNVGKLCNQACHHCHVDAGPKRTEVMTTETAERVLGLLAASPDLDTLDITGGAPELNPSFEYLGTEAHALGKKVIVRCNLTVLFEPGMERLPEIYRDNRIEVIASLPCYLEENVDAQRGNGVFDLSIEALRLLNGIGYGRPGSELELHLVHNPIGASLPPEQAALEETYKAELHRRYEIEFNRLFTVTNMPIARFAEQLYRERKTEEYMGLLVNHFNASTLPSLMCRSLLSVCWEGKLYDCDFNQMLELPIGRQPRALSASKTTAAPTIWDIPDVACLEGYPIRTADHCLGCTAGAGSSCGGSLLG